MKIQVAFQGGGAKLCDLLAAAEALQDMKGSIEVVRVAGTSAGSIVACLFASGIPISEIRHRIALLGREHLTAIVGNRSRMGAAWNLLLGKPIYSEPHLASFLNELFTHKGTAFRSFGQLKKCDVVLTTADISSGEAVFYRGTDPTQNFVQCILDSCAIPFIFRNGVVGSSMVDGGVCENLPAAMMTDRKEDVLGFSFMRRPITIASTRAYLSAIIDTMVGHSVNRARMAVGADNIFDIDTDVGTLDFEKCLSVLEGKDGHYDRVVRDCTLWLKNRATDLQRVRPPTLEQLMMMVNEVHEAQHRQTDVTIQKMTKHIIANGLLPEAYPESKSDDEVQDTLTLLPSKDHPLRSFRLGSSSKFGATTSLINWRLTDGKHENVPATPIPVYLNLPGISSDSFVIFFFGRGLTFEQGPYQFERHSGQKHALNGLQKRDPEFVVSRSTHAVERYELVVYLPDAYAGTVLHDASDPNYPIPSSFERPTKAGRVMTQAELNAHPSHGRFVSKGWVYENVAPGSRFGVILVPVGRPAAH